MFMRAELQRAVQATSPDDMTLRTWYEARRDRYAPPPGFPKNTDLFTLQHERVLSDFLEERLATVRGELLADLRPAHRIEFTPGALE
jgi:hypothetical protein